MRAVGNAGSGEINKCAQLVAGQADFGLRALLVGYIPNDDDQALGGGGFQVVQGRDADLSIEGTAVSAQSGEFDPFRLPVLQDTLHGHLDGEMFFFLHQIVERPGLAPDRRTTRGS